MSRFTFYYYPTSYNSQKVYLALLEKEANFNTVIVNIHGGEQLEAWYMRINPNGDVPTLLDGSKVIFDSEKMIEYIDSHVTGTTLVPHLESTIGQQVNAVRETLDKINIDLITFGVLCHPQLTDSKIQVPPFDLVNQEVIRELIESNATKAEQLAEKHADLREAYLSTHGKLKGQLEQYMSKDTVTKHLDDLENVFDKMEGQLGKSNENAGLENWLFGPRFTAADISFTILLDRIVLLGLEERYFPIEKRPHIFAYKQKLGNRKTVQKVREMVKSLPWVTLKCKAKKVMPYVGCIAAVSLAVGFAIVKIKK